MRSVGTLGNLPNVPTGRQTSSYFFYQPDVPPGHLNDNWFSYANILPNPMFEIQKITFNNQYSTLNIQVQMDKASLLQ